jgi:C4-dicarboxylate transporter
MMTLIIVQVVLTTLAVFFIRKFLAVRECRHSEQKNVLNRGSVTAYILLSLVPIAGIIVVLIGISSTICNNSDDIEWKTKKNSNEPTRFSKWLNS